MKEWKCWFRHRWEVHQHCIRAADNDRVFMVLAWKQCERCAKSKVIHVFA